MIQKREEHFLVAPPKVLILPWHITLRCMENFVEAMDKHGEGFRYFKEKFLTSEAKLQAVIFTRPQIREVLKNGNFYKVCL